MTRVDEACAIVVKDAHGKARALDKLSFLVAHDNTGALSTHSREELRLAILDLRDAATRFLYELEAASSRTPVGSLS